MGKRIAAVVILFAVSAVVAGALLGRHSEPVLNSTAAVQTEGEAIALVDDRFAPRLQGGTIESRSATLVTNTEEYRDATTIGLVALGPKHEGLPVWVVTFMGSWPSHPNPMRLRYVVEARTGKFLVQPVPMPVRVSAFG